MIFNNILSVNEKNFNKKNNPEELRTEDIIQVLMFVKPYLTDKISIEIHKELEKRNYIKAES